MTFFHCSFLWWATVAGCILNLSVGLLPQTSQEGLLRPYRNYADVTLFHYFVPTEVTRATFEFAAFMDSPGCPARDVYIYLQHGSYPVFSAYGDNSTFPQNMFIERDSMFSIMLHATYQPQDTTRFPIHDPLPGNWFATAYLPDWDQNVQQEGIGHKCQYSLGSIALWTQVPNVQTVPLETTMRLSSGDRFTYLKFYVPSGVWEFTLKIDGCETRSHFRENQFTTSTPSRDKKLNNGTQNKKDFLEQENICIKNVFLRAKALPTYNPANALPGVLLEKNDSSIIHVESLPQPDSYYYLLIVATTKISYNVSIMTRECQVQILGKSFVQHFSGISLTTNMKEQAIRMNLTNGTKPRDLLKPGCDCVPIFRLTRIKHAQDFSDTFLLEGREWFTSWVALTDTMPVGASFEILPFVDIGGTLSISVHMDELLLNATSQIIEVIGCIKKSSPPEPLCCASENISDCCPEDLTLHISSTNLTSVDDYILIPYPEPDVWYISFTTICYYEGKRVPCVVEEALVSLDVRTQPCVLTKPSSGQGSPIYPCGLYGLCQEVHKGQFFYTACHCLGGYRGWACNDDSHATPEYLLVTTTLLLTLSNIFFIPAIVLALKRRMFTQVLVYFTTMVSSTLYHACDQDIYGYCLTRYQVLQFCDFFCSILAFWVTLIALAKSPPKYDSALYMMGAIVIAIGVEYNRTGLMVFIIPFCLGIGIPISVWTYRSIQLRKLITPTLSSLLLFTPGLLLGGAGLILFAFVETEDNYRYTHSAWHVIIALSLVYLLPKQDKKKDSAEVNENGAVDSTNTSELAAVNDYQVTSSSPVFFVTSDLDHLVQEVR